MSTTTFRFSHRKNGTLTNVTSVVMSDPTGMFGAVRNDTDATVVADGTAMTQVGTGVYEYELTDPAAGLEYTWWAEWTYGGLTHRAEFTTLGGSTGEDAAGDYWTWAGMKAILGQANAEIASQLDNETTDADFERIEADGEIADAYTNRRARLAGHTVPLTAETTDDFLLVQYATNLYASYLLARHRAWFGLAADERDKLVNLEGEAKDLYDTLFGADPTGIDGTVDEDADELGAGEWAMVEFERTPIVDEDEYSDD